MNLRTLPNYERVMYIKYKDGKTTYVKPHSYSILPEWRDEVFDYYEIFEPKGSYLNAETNFFGE